MHRAQPLAWRGLVLLVALTGALGGCAPTHGTDTSFKVFPTTNFNLVPELVPVGLNPLNVAVADYSYAGSSCPGRTPDLAVTNFLDDTVTLLVNDGSGQFPASNITTLGAGPSAAPRTYGPSTLFFANLGAGTCEQDLVVVDITSSTLSVFLQNGATSAAGSGTWSAAQTYQMPGTIVQVTPVDVNADGYLDLVVAVPEASSILTLVNQGAAAPGQLAPAALATIFNTPNRFAVLPDINGDGLPDLAVLSGTDSGLDVLLSTAAPGVYSVQPPIVMEVGPFAIGNADFDGDGIQDVLISMPAIGHLWLLQGSRSFPYFGFYPGTPYVVPFNAQRFALGAFGPGPGIDAAVVHPLQSRVTIMINNPVGSINLYSIETQLSPAEAVTGRFSPGGVNLDFAVNETHERIVYVFEGDGNGNFTPTEIGFANVVTSPRAAKLRGPTQVAQDIVAVQPNDSNLLILRNINP